MEKILIAIPTLDMVPAVFAHSLTCLIRPESSMVTMISNALVYNARNMLAQEAINNGFERVLWLDSDMAFSRDLLLRLNKDIDDGMDVVTALAFKRTLPTAPTIYEAKRNGKYKVYLDYPENAVFQIAGCGFGACMMKTAVLKDILESYGDIFIPNETGEDLAFCSRAADVGYKIWCDSRIHVGHIGLIAFGEEHYNKHIMLGLPDRFFD